MEKIYVLEVIQIGTEKVVGAHFFTSDTAAYLARDYMQTRVENVRFQVVPVIGKMDIHSPTRLTTFNSRLNRNCLKQGVWTKAGDLIGKLEDLLDSKGMNYADLFTLLGGDINDH